MIDEDTKSHIRRENSSREDLLIYTIDGHMNSDDIIAVYTELLATYKHFEKIDLLVKMKNFDGFDWSAIWSDTTYAAKTKSLKHIRRYAIVGAPSWMRAMVSVFDPLFSVEMKTFDSDEEESALAWLNEKSETA